MLLKKFSPQTLLRIAMSFLLLFFGLEVVARLLPARTPFWDGVIDGVRGVVFGIYFGLMILLLRSKRVAS